MPYVTRLKQKDGKTVIEFVPIPELRLLPAAPDRRQQLIEEAPQVAHRVRAKLLLEQLRDVEAAAAALQRGEGPRPEVVPGVLRPAAEAVAEQKRPSAFWRALEWVTRQTGRPWAAFKAAVRGGRPGEAFLHPERAPERIVRPEELPASWPEPVRRAVSFAAELAGSIALDPTTYIGVGPAARVAQAGKLVQTVKAARATEAAARLRQAARAGKLGVRRSLGPVLEGARLKPAAKPELSLQLAGRKVTSLEPAAEAARGAWRGAVLAAPEPVREAVNRLIGAFRLTAPRYLPEMTAEEHAKLGQLLPRVKEKLLRGATEARLAGEEAVRHRTIGVPAEVRRAVPHYIEAGDRAAFLAKLPPETRPLVEQTAWAYEQEMATLAERLKKAFGPDYLNVIEDYVTHVYHDSPQKVRRALEKWRKLRLPGSTFPFAKERTIPTLEQAKALGLHPVEDIGVIEGVYRVAAERALNLKQTADWLARKGLLLPAADAPAEWVDAAQFAPFLAGRRLHPEVARVFNALKPAMELHSRELADLAMAWRRATNLFKGAVTSLRPAFHFVNIMGNHLLMRMAGIGYPEQLAALAKAVKHRALQDETYQLFRRLGLEGHGLFADATASLKPVLKYLEDYQRQLTGTGFGKVARILVSPLSAGRAAGMFTDDVYRLAAWLHFRGKGFSADEAARLVRRYMFDYTQLTPTERAIRDWLVPFYTWTRYSIPRSILALAEAPGAYSGYFHLQELAAKEAGVKPEELPEWLQPAVVLAETPEGKIIHVNPQVLWQWAYTVLGPQGGREVGEFIARSLHPAFRGLPILLTGVDPLTGRKVSQAEPQLTARARELARAVSPVWELEKAHAVEPADRRLRVTGTALPGLAGAATSFVGTYDRPLGEALTLRRAEDLVDEYLRARREQGEAIPMYEDVAQALREREQAVQALEAIRAVRADAWRRQVLALVLQGVESPTEVLEFFFRHGDLFTGTGAEVKAKLGRLFTQENLAKLAVYLGRVPRPRDFFEHRTWLESGEAPLTPEQRRAKRLLEQIEALRRAAGAE